MPLPRSKPALLSLAACAAGALLLLGAILLQSGRVPVSAAAAVGGPFALVDQDGRPVTEAAYKGRPFVVFFGYTHCPDFCPTTLSDMTLTLDALGPAATVPALFVTVDPERDTSAVLKQYLSSFDPRIVGLTGDAAAVAAAERSFRVYARKGEVLPDGRYTMDHTAVVYLMGRDGTFLSALDLSRPKEAAATIARAL